MKILMLNPPFLPKYSRNSRSPAVTKGGTIYMPIWLSYAIGTLEKEGFEVIIKERKSWFGKRYFLAVIFTKLFKLCI